MTLLNKNSEPKPRYVGTIANEVQALVSQLEEIAQMMQKPKKNAAEVERAIALMIKEIRIVARYAEGMENATSKALSTARAFIANPEMASIDEGFDVSFKEFVLEDLLAILNSTTASKEEKSQARALQARVLRVKLSRVSNQGVCCENV